MLRWRPAIYKLNIMWCKRVIPVKCCVLVITGLLSVSQARAQVVQTGIKSGLNMSWVRYEDSGVRYRTNVRPVLGWNAGFVAAFKMKDRFFLNTELIYSRKGRITVNDKDHTVAEQDELRDRTIYQYIEIPIIYNVHFKGHLKLKNVRNFKWYAGIGPNFSYWLSGKGNISHYDLTEFGGPDANLDYKLKFGKKPPEADDESSIVYADGVRRFQLGVNIGGGLLLEPIGKQKIMVDLRFELGHTWLGTGVADFTVPAKYDDNLKARNMGLRFSVMYLLEHNLDKKVRKRGKSDFKKRRL